MIGNGTEIFINKVIWMLGKQNNGCGGWVKRRASEEAGAEPTRGGQAGGPRGDVSL